ncbi:MAG: DUF2062 domain-containing protein [Alphaproteobacteria bacterium]|nr:MAG: DUF2062 domain-containing protein [Alphaproteobacteria bacterium]
MLFRRRIPLRWWQRVRNALWPTSGWRRSGKYLWRRLARLRDSPHGIAAGVASGIAISFTPFMGFHLIGAMGLALVTRGNVIAAWIGTLVGNPWTFPFIWLLIHRVGTWILGLPPTAEAERLSIDLLVAHPAVMIESLLWPMSVGGVTLAVLTWFASYWPLRRALERFQESRRLRIIAVSERKARDDRVGPGDMAHRV